MSSEKTVFFSGINGLRFFAALAVIITHTELMKGVFGFTNYWDSPLIFNLGGLGVYFFFVLSGFLITYLLLKEKEKFGRIHVKAFYMRRILRIWPLYYLILLLGFFILPHFSQIQIPYLLTDFNDYFGTNLLFYLLILPNVAYSFFTAVPHIGQSWSIGIEEQFYIVWPWLISRSKNILKTLFVVVIALILFKVVILVLGHFYSQDNWYAGIKRLVAMSKFECMAIGGFGAFYLFTNKTSILNFAYKKLVLFTALGLIPILVYITPDFIQDGIHLVYSILFLIVILNVAKRDKLFENPVLSYLGKISYGIYMYHLMIIPIVLFAFKHYLILDEGFLLNTLIYLAVISITIMVSALSYNLFENYFIRLKHTFSLIKSGKKD
ncbi:acyltransferase family protein [Aurantibacillus circumpalustris]|uniref:acyltransferase family protein n=1 Tax=Aurantibacillus circumpalustris TaxID=3036359 RepID=UPI00295BFE9C|nr:acyltransferase [Aurantibacillus circumpalustris]